jgi:hypothetical protein
MNAKEHGDFTPSGEPQYGGLIDFKRIIISFIILIIILISWIIINGGGRA